MTARDERDGETNLPAADGRERSEGRTVSGGPVTRYREFFAPLGELTIAFALMEQQIDNARRVLESSHYPDAAIGAPDDDIKRKIRRFHGAAVRSVTTRDLRDELPSLVRDLDDARVRRNRAQHGPWLGIDQKTRAAAKIGDRTDPFEWHDNTPASLQGDAGFCLDVGKRVAVWTSRFINEEMASRNVVGRRRAGDR